MSYPLQFDLVSFRLTFKKNKKFYFNLSKPPIPVYFLGLTSTLTKT